MVLRGGRDFSGKKNFLIFLWWLKDLSLLILFILYTQIHLFYAYDCTVITTGNGLAAISPWMITLIGALLQLTTGWWSWFMDTTYTGFLESCFTLVRSSIFQSSSKPQPDVEVFQGQRLKPSHSQGDASRAATEKRKPQQEFEQREISASFSVAAIKHTDKKHLIEKGLTLAAQNTTHNGRRSRQPSLKQLVTVCL